MDIVFSDHAKEQLKRRGISQKAVRQLLQQPQEILPSFRGRRLQRATIDDRLLEVVTRTEEENIIVITAYYLEE